MLTANVAGADLKQALFVASGVEMLHTATLVHDDLIDGARVRRGVETLNANGRTEAAVLAGDYLFARAAHLVAQASNVRVMELFAETLMVILNGEINQHASKWLIERNGYERRIYAKTAALFVLAVQAPAVLGKMDVDQVDALVEFGRSTGMAFQMIDDILDYTGDSKVIGKPNGSDLRQGLFTLPVIYYQEIHPNDPDLQILLRTKDGSHSSVERLIESVKRSDAVERALNEAHRFASRGQRALEILPDTAFRSALSEMAVSLIQRKL